eukprot:COSAG06_NODE_731_length_12727_cov_14.734083_2_plen_262_part_00
MITSRWPGHSSSTPFIHSCSSIRRDCTVCSSLPPPNHVFAGNPSVHTGGTSSLSLQHAASGSLCAPAAAGRLQGNNARVSQGAELRESLGNAPAVLGGCGAAQDVVRGVPAVSFQPRVDDLHHVREVAQVLGRIVHVLRCAAPRRAALCGAGPGCVLLGRDARGQMAAGAAAVGAGDDASSAIPPLLPVADSERCGTARAHCFLLPFVQPTAQGARCSVSALHDQAVLRESRWASCWASAARTRRRRRTSGGSRERNLHLS